MDCVRCVGVSVLPGEAQMWASHRSSSSPKTLTLPFPFPIRIPILCCCAISRACIVRIPHSDSDSVRTQYISCVKRGHHVALRGRQEHAACQKTMGSAAQTQAPKPWGGGSQDAPHSIRSPMCRGRTTPPLLSRLLLPSINRPTRSPGAPDHECNPQAQPWKAPPPRPSSPASSPSALFERLEPPADWHVESGLLQARSPRQRNRDSRNK
jgi:hypothetical protein